MWPMYNEPELPSPKTTTRAQPTAPVRSGRTFSSGCMFCAAIEGSKTSMETSTSMEDAVLTAWPPNAKKNFVTQVLVLALLRKFLSDWGECWRHAVCELTAG
jgi:hypothetical protein